MLNQWRPELGLPLIRCSVYGYLAFNLILDLRHIHNLIILHGSLLKQLFVALLWLLFLLEVKHDRQDCDHYFVDAYL